MADDVIEQYSLTFFYVAYDSYSLDNLTQFVWETDDRRLRDKVFESLGLLFQYLNPGTQDFLEFDIEKVYEFDETESLEDASYPDRLLADILEKEDIFLIKNYTLEHKDVRYSSHEYWAGGAYASNEYFKSYTDEYFDDLDEVDIVSSDEDIHGVEHLIGFDKYGGIHMFAFFCKRRQVFIVHKKYRKLFRTDKGLFTMSLSKYKTLSINDLYMDKGDYDQKNKGWMNKPTYIVTVDKTVENYPYNPLDLFEFSIFCKNHYKDAKEIIIRQMEKFVPYRRRDGRRQKSPFRRSNHPLHEQWRLKNTKTVVRTIKDEKGNLIQVARVVTTLKRKRIYTPTYEMVMERNYNGEITIARHGRLSEIAD